MKVLGVFGMVAAAVLAVAGTAVFLWAAFLDSIVYEDNPRPYEADAFLGLMITVALVSAAGWLWQRSHAPVSPDGDPGLTASVIFAVVLYGGFAILVILVILRVTGVTGPIFTDDGI